MHLSTLWVSANKNWTFACLALAKKNYKIRILKNRPSTLDTSTKSQTHVRNSKKEETCQGHVLHFNDLKGLAVEKAKNRPGRRCLLFSRLRRSVVPPRKPPCYAGYEHQQHSIWKTTNCHVTSHAVTPVLRKQCHTLVPHLIHLPHMPRREIFCSVCWFLRQWEKIGCSFTILFLCSVSILLYPLLFYPSKFPAVSYSGKF